MPRAPHIQSRSHSFATVVLTARGGTPGAAGSELSDPRDGYLHRGNHNNGEGKPGLQSRPSGAEGHTVRLHRTELGALRWRLVLRRPDRKLLARLHQRRCPACVLHARVLQDQVTGGRVRLCERHHQRLFGHAGGLGPRRRSRRQDRRRKRRGPRREGADLEADWRPGADGLQARRGGLQHRGGARVQGGDQKHDQARQAAHPAPGAAGRAPQGLQRRGRQLSGFQGEPPRRRAVPRGWHP